MNYKYLYIGVLICVLPAYTQIREVKKKELHHVDSINDARIEPVKRNAYIDFGLFKIYVRKRVKDDSTARVAAKDSAVNKVDSTKTN